MGDRYEGAITCPYCRLTTEFYYAPTCGFEIEICEHCKKKFKIETNLVAKKLIKRRKRNE